MDLKKLRLINKIALIGGMNIFAFYKNGSLTHTFNIFNCLVIDMRKFNIKKTKYMLVLKVF